MDVAMKKNDGAQGLTSSVFLQLLEFVSCETVPYTYCSHLCFGLHALLHKGRPN